MGLQGVDREYVSRVIRDVRDRLNCKQSEFARLCGVSTAAVNRWENQHSLPNRRRWERINDLDQRSRQVENPDQLKRKLLVAEVYAGDSAPIELLHEGCLDNVVSEGVGRDDFTVA